MTRPFLLRPFWQRRLWRTVSAAAPAAWLVLASGCGTTARPPLELDCSAGDAYEFDTLFDFESSELQWFSFSDETPGSSISFTTESVEGGGRCGSRRALVLRSQGCNFWGTGFGEYKYQDTPANGAGWEGVSFWARSPGAVDRSVIFLVEDRTSSAAGGECVDYGADAGTTASVATAVDPEGRTTSSAGGATCPLAEDACGNSFRTTVQTSERWQLYLLPWSTLVQDPCPNRVPDGIDESAIHQFLVRAPQGWRIEFWIDDISFYRKLRDG
jgi:hypothetical protein